MEIIDGVLIFEVDNKDESSDVISKKTVYLICKTVAINSGLTGQQVVILRNIPFLIIE